MILDDVIRACYEFIRTNEPLSLVNIRNAEIGDYPEVDSNEWAHLVFYFFKKNHLSFNVLMTINHAQTPGLLLESLNALEEYGAVNALILQYILSPTTKVREFVQNIIYAQQHGIYLNRYLLFYLAQNPVSNLIISTLFQLKYLNTQVLQSCMAAKSPEQYAYHLACLPLDFIYQHEAFLLTATINQLMALNFLIEEGLLSEDLLQYIVWMPDDALDYVKAASTLRIISLDEGTSKLNEFYESIKRINHLPCRLQNYAEFKISLVKSPQYQGYEQKLKKYYYPAHILKAISNLTEQGILQLPTETTNNIPKIFHQLSMEYKISNDFDPEKIIQLTSLWALLKKKKINTAAMETQWLEISSPKEIEDLCDILNEVDEKDQVKILKSKFPKFIFSLTKIAPNIGDIAYKKINDLRDYSAAQREMMVKTIKIIHPLVNLNNFIFDNIKPPDKLSATWLIIQLLDRLNINSRDWCSRIIRMEKAELLERAEIIRIFEQNKIIIDVSLTHGFLSCSLVELKLFKKIIAWIELSQDSISDILGALDLNELMSNLSLLERVFFYLAQFNLLSKKIIANIVYWTAQYGHASAPEQLFGLLSQKINALIILRDEGLLESHINFIVGSENPLDDAQYYRLLKYYPKLKWPLLTNNKQYLSLLLALHEEDLFSYDYAQLLSECEYGQSIVELIKLCHYYSFNCSALLIQCWIQDQIPLVDLIKSMYLVHKSQLLTQGNFQLLLACKQSLSHLHNLLREFNGNQERLTIEKLHLFLKQVQHQIYLSIEQQQILNQDTCAAELLSSLIYCQKIGLSYTENFHKLLLSDYRNALFAFEQHKIDSRNLGETILNSDAPLQLLEILLPTLVNKVPLPRTQVNNVGIFAPPLNKKITYSQAQDAGRLTHNTPTPVYQNLAIPSNKR